MYTYRTLQQDLATLVEENGDKILDLPVVTDDFTVSGLAYQPHEAGTEEYEEERETLYLQLND